MNDREALTNTIVEFNVIFAQHRLEVIQNSRSADAKKKTKSVYTRSLPGPLNLKEDLTVELALMEN